MNGDLAMAEALCAEIVTGARAMNGVEIVVCPPFTLLNTVNLVIQDSNCKLGAQDMDLNENGAFTGQISNTMLKDSGCEYVILGHSERRTG